VRHKDDDREFLPSTGAIREQRRRPYISIRLSRGSVIGKRSPASAVGTDS
jgi:hypothetical protein